MVQLPDNKAAFFFFLVLYEKKEYDFERFFKCGIQIVLNIL